MDSLLLYEISGLGNIYQENHEFISSASDRAESMLLTLSELHAGLMVLQSSQFGISFIIDANIRLGNVLSQVTDLVSEGRSYALYNMVALHAIDSLMHLIKWMTPWLLLLSEAALLCLIAADSWLSHKTRWQMSLIRCSEATLAVTLLLMVVIPASVFLVSHSSKAVTQVFYNKSYQAIVDTHEHILQDADASSIKSEASSALSQFKSAKVKVSQKSSYLATNITRYIAIAALEVFLLPLLFGALMFWLCISLIKRHRHWQS
ncbi:hypothetical protein [Endozoicomonas sp. Mp262]|uniref:hypothetical protein n=1 Tax=Endozoicomonas sp. Mp262 TaxID=2919499 RepID=UPI0021DACA12